MTTDGGTIPVREGGRSAAKAIGATTAATAFGYAITLLQQVLYARTLGVSADTDALGAALAWAVGTTGLVGTTLATVFLPRFVRAPEDSGEAAALRARVTKLALVAGGAALVFTLIGAQWLATLLAPGADDARRATLAELLRIGAPLEVTWPLVWLAVSSANARERYLLAAGSAILPPLPVIGILLSGAATVHMVAFAYVVGTLLQLGVLWALEPQSRPLFSSTSSSTSIAIMRDVLPVGAVFALLSVIPLAIRGLASIHGVGAIAIADYASRLVLAGQQVLLSGLLAVTFTRWSRASEAKGAAGIDSVQRTLLLVGVAGIAITAFLPFIAVELTRIIFSGGRFEASDAAAVGGFVAWMGPGIAGSMLLMVAARALFAIDRVAQLVLASAGAVASSLVVGLVAQNLLGLNGVAAGYSAAYAVGAAIAIWAIRSETAAERTRRRSDGAFPIPPSDVSLLALHEDVV